MNNLIIKAIVILMALGTSAILEATQVQMKTGAVVIVLDGKQPLYHSLHNCQNPPNGVEKYVLILDSKGKTVLQHSFTQKVATISTQQLASGIYTLLLSANGCSNTTSFTK